MVYQDTCHYLLGVVIAIATCSVVRSDVPRPRGVSLLNTSLYYPNRDGIWMCIDGSLSIPFKYINDDYCDCPDGSDEPGTAACPGSIFHCVNRGYRPLDIPSSRVNDGVCDCCDTSDEYDSTSEVTCHNTCEELGRYELEQRRWAMELHRQGATKRAEMVTNGKQWRGERNQRYAEVELRREEQLALKAAKEELKKQAELLEGEAIRLYKEMHENDRETGSSDSMNIEEEALAAFQLYDSNSDNWIEISEIQVYELFDRDHNGEVSYVEAKEILDQNERVNFEDFKMKCWPRIKSMQMLAEGIFKPPETMQSQDIPEATANTEDSVNAAATHLEEDGENQSLEPELLDTADGETGEDVDEGEEEGYEEDDSDADGVGSVTEMTTTPPVYDPETQRLIELADEARHEYSKAEQELRTIEQELNDLKIQLEKDYGAHDEFAILYTNCYKFEDREYVYTLCPFDRTSQQPRNGGAETNLGRWDNWVMLNDNKYARQRYSQGASCWNGPQRSTVVNFRCGLESRITGVSEPSRCEYMFDFETPASCDETAFKEAEHHIRDEL